MRRRQKEEINKYLYSSEKGRKGESLFSGHNLTRDLSPLSARPITPPNLSSHPSFAALPTSFLLLPHTALHHCFLSSSSILFNSVVEI
jgi:hypothetical protein